MDLQNINKLKENHEKGLQICLEKIHQWEKFKADYEALKQRLETIPDQISYDITVPLGPQAFTMGKLVHTNEVMVLLGDNWFAEVSSKQAAEISSRRIDQCSKMLDDLRKEEAQFKNWLSYMNEVSESENLVEIVETYDADAESQWREQHARNVKAHAQKISEEKKSLSGNNKEEKEKDYLAVLEELELKESQAESEDSNVECSVDDLQQSDESCTSNSLQLNLNCSNHENEILENSEEISRKVTSENGEEISRKVTSENDEEITRKVTSENDEEISRKVTSENQEKIEQDCTNSLNECSCPNNTKHVRWQDLSKQNIKTITFKHSNPKNKNSKVRNVHIQKSDEVQPLIQSPSDIYKHFDNLFQAAPKSILKIKSPPIETSKPFFHSQDSIQNKNKDDILEELINEKLAFTGTISERTEFNASLQSTNSRPMSQFKASRKNRRK